jgi:TonB family protein
LAAAIALTAIIAFIFTLGPDEFAAGGGGQKIDAISVTIVSSNVLESREVDRTLAAAPASASNVDRNDGAPDSAPAAEQREQKERKDELKKFEEPVRAVEALSEVPLQAKRQQKQESAAAASGGDAVRSETRSETKTSAPAAASAGALREYARYVALALTKSKPRGAGVVGTARIKFVIGPDGALATAEIVKSSGNKRLDDDAMAALRRTSFPVPPPNMTILQLTYEVPYHFR